MTTPYAPPGSRTRAPSGLAVATVVLAIAFAVAELGTVLASFSAADDFREVLEDGGSTWDVFTLYDGLESLLFPVMVAAYVVACLWLQTARKNTAVLAPALQHARRPVWVWLGWWVPIVALWFPYQVVRDVRDGSMRRGVTIGLGLWWTAWLVYAGGNRVTTRIASSDSTDTVALLPLFECIGAVAVVVACVQWCRVVRTITASQEQALSPR